MKLPLLGLLLALSLGLNAWLYRAHRAGVAEATDLRARVARVEADTAAMQAETRRLSAASAANGLSEREREELQRLRALSGDAGVVASRRAALTAEIARLQQELSAAPTAPVADAKPPTPFETVAHPSVQLEESIRQDEALVEEWNRMPEEDRGEWLARMQPTPELGELLGELYAAEAGHQRLLQEADADPVEVERLATLAGSLHQQLHQQAVTVMAGVTGRLAESRAALEALQSAPAADPLRPGPR